MGQVFGPGDYHRAPAGSIHGPSSSKEGCTFICFSAPLCEVVADELVPRDLREMTILRSSLELSPDNAESTIETLFSTGDRPFMTALIRSEILLPIQTSRRSMHRRCMSSKDQARLNDLLGERRRLPLHRIRTSLRNLFKPTQAACFWRTLSCSTQPSAISIQPSASERPGIFKLVIMVRRH